MRTLALTALCLLAPVTHAEDRRADTSKLCIMNFNVEFMWDGIAPQEGHDNIELPYRGNPALAAEKMTKIAAIIREHDPDMINLDEVDGIDGDAPSVSLITWR